MDNSESSQSEQKPVVQAIAIKPANQYQEKEFKKTNYLHLTPEQQLQVMNDQYVIKQVNYTGQKIINLIFAQIEGVGRIRVITKDIHMFLELENQQYNQKQYHQSFQEIFRDIETQFTKSYDCIKTDIFDAYCNYSYDCFPEWKNYIQSHVFRIGDKFYVLERGLLLSAASKVMFQLSTNKVKEEMEKIGFIVRLYVDDFWILVPKDAINPLQQVEEIFKKFNYQMKYSKTFIARSFNQLLDKSRKYQQLEKYIETKYIKEVVLENVPQQYKTIEQYLQEKAKLQETKQHIIPDAKPKMTKEEYIQMKKNYQRNQLLKYAGIFIACNVVVQLVFKFLF